MKILQIDSINEFSSTGRTTSQLHKYLLSQGHESYIAACNVETSGNYIKLCTSVSQHVHSFLSHLLGKQGYFSFFDTHRLLKQIDRIAPDVVHLRVLHSNCINFPLLLKYLSSNRIPTVITLHDCWYFTGHCCYFTDTNCVNWKSKCGHCPDIKRWNKSWFFDNSSSNLKDKYKLFSGIEKLAVIGVSDWITAFIKDSILKDAYIIRRIYNWVDINQFKPCKSDLRNKLKIGSKFFVVSISKTWSIEKGILDIKEIASKLPDFVFVIVGHLPENFFPLPQNIILVGSITSVKDLSQFYSEADLFLNPSARETFGKVTAEALSCGTPVVAYDVTATSELVSEDCGVLIPYHNVSGLIDGVKKVHDKGKTAYSDKCRAFAKAQFDPSFLMEQYISLYNEMISR